MGFINIKDADGNEHTIHTSQLPAVTQKLSVSFSCPSCSELKQLLIEALPLVELEFNLADSIVKHMKRYFPRSDATSADNTVKQIADLKQRIKQAIGEQS